MKGYLLDTHVVSELRKGERADPNLLAWFHSADDEELFLSVLVLGEVRSGVERIRRKDPSQARVWNVGYRAYSVLLLIVCFR